MNISSLIKQLEDLQEQHGNLTVNVLDCEGYDEEADRLELRYQVDPNTWRDDVSKPPCAIIIR